MKDNFVKCTDVHQYGNRSRLNFYVPQVDGFTSSSFYYNGITDWNALPDNIKSIESKFTFKKLVKTHLLNDMKVDENSMYFYF